MKNINVLLNERIPVKIHPGLRHLSPLEIQQLVWDYLGNKVSLKDICVRYNLNVNLKRLNQVLPPEVLDKKCPVCNHPMVRQLPTRSQVKNIKSMDEDYGYGYVENYAYCPNCDHSEEPNCECYMCVEKRNNEKAEKDKIIAKNKAIILDYNENIPKISCNIEDLGYKEKLFLITLIKFASMTELRHIGPIDRAARVYNCLALGDMEEKIVNYLFKNRFIKVSLDSSDDAFYCENNFFDFRLVDFYLNFEYEGDENDLIDKLLNFKIDVFDENLLDELEELWIETAKEHCFRFFKREMEYYYKNKEIEISQKIKTVIKDLLKSYSVFEIYGIISKAVKLKKRDLKNRKIDCKDFQNEVINVIWNFDSNDYAEYNIKDEINPKPVFTNLLFGKLLKIDSKGYLSPPNKNIIKECNS